LTIPYVTCSYSEYKAEMGVPVSISLGEPRFWKEKPAHKIRGLCPPSKYFKASAEVFAQKYIEHLDLLGVDLIHKALADITEQVAGQTLVLLCFEKNVRGPMDCHRRRFAEWWFQQTGEWIPELGGSWAQQQAEPPKVINPTAVVFTPPKTETVILSGDTQEPLEIPEELLFRG
jgi:hypothetical protein